MTRLYNGIILPPVWPPQRDIDPGDDTPMTVPYLESPPAVIPIDVGRQLFVDDFLIAESTLTRRFHSAVPYAGNPVMAPSTPLEQGHGLAAAVPKGGGVWWDPGAGHYRMWYDAGWSHAYAYATSSDGITWQRPVLPGQTDNRILPQFMTNSSTALIDFHETDPRRRFKMFIRQPDKCEPGHGLGWAVTKGRARAHVMYSADGVNWSDPVVTSDVGDRSSVFYNPFRRKWVYSIRSYHFGTPFARTRHYRECDDLIAEAQWPATDACYWTRADSADLADPEIGSEPQLYNLDAIGYESLMLGLFEIHLGPDNNTCAQGGFPKTIDLKLGFSRDGFHWARPSRDAFIPSSRRPGDWDRGYVQSVGGCCLVFADELRFYYTGFRGDPTKASDKESDDNGMYANASTGIATLRRDGFASLETGGSGTVTTRPVLFSGRYLFVNIDTPAGELTVELLTEDDSVIPGFSREACVPVSTDSCKHRLAWRDRDDLGALAGTPVRFRFHLRSGRLYSFWVSRLPTGESGGYLAAGSPDYPDFTDGANGI